MASRRQGPPAAQPGINSRAERLKLALRQNLKRRKAQSKARERQAGVEPHDSAGFRGKSAPEATGDKLDD